MPDIKEDIPNRFTYDSDEGLVLLPTEKIEESCDKNVIKLHSAPIRSEDVREFVRERIDFPLTDEQWLVIDVAMGNYWNNRKIGSWIGNEDMAGFIFRYCEEEKMLISWERILKITNQIWAYLEMKGRLIEDCLKIISKNISEDSTVNDNKTRRIFKDGNINRDNVKSAVFNRINFPLTDKIWNEIDKAFGRCWNKKIGLGGDIYEDFIVQYVYEALVKKKILFEYSRIDKIVEIILDYIKMTGGFMDEPEEL